MCSSLPSAAIQTEKNTCLTQMCPGLSERSYPLTRFSLSLLISGRERFMRSFSLFRTNKWFSLKSVPVSPAMDGRHIICLPEAKSWINQVCSKKDNVDLIHYIHENCLLEKEDLIIRKYICKQLCIYPLQSILHH